MSLKVHVIKRTLRAGQEAGAERFFGQVRLRERIPLQKLAQRVSANSSATEADVAMVINGLVTVLSENLDSGHIVELEDFGNFRISAGSEGAESKEKFHCRMMRKPKIVFTPGKRLTHMLEEVRYEWLPVVTEKGEVNCDKAHV